MADYLGGWLIELSSDLVLEQELEPGPSCRIGWNWCNTKIMDDKILGLLREWGTYHLCTGAKKPLPSCLLGFIGMPMNACDLRAFLQTIMIVLRKCERLGISTKLFVFYFELMRIAQVMEQDKEARLQTSNIAPS